MTGPADSIFREEALRWYGDDQRRVDPLRDVPRSLLITLWVGAGLLCAVLAVIGACVAELIR
jgi:hypothetical protein